MRFLTPRFLFLFSLLILCGCLLIKPAFAQDPTEATLQELQNTISDLQQKIATVQKESQTLSSAISYLTLKQSLITKQINATQFQIQLLQRDISSLGGKITLLENTLNSLTAALLRTVTASYQNRQVDSVEAMLSSRNFSSVVSSFKYLQIAQQYRKDLLFKTTQTKFEYDQEKTLKEQKQAEVSKLKASYVKQQQELIFQQKAKQLLLSQTKNSESNYQQLLSQAITQLNSLRGFSQSKGGGLLSPQISPDGWYYSQRDERWGNMCIGNSCGTRNQGTIMEVGCLIADVAMVKKKYGEDVTPASIAAVHAYFFSNTAYMLQPWPTPNGYYYLRSGFDRTKVDNNLREDRPVIVHLRVNNRDGHFVVLKSGSDGNYTMHDPWEGFDKKFTDFYSLGQIDSAAYLMKK